MPIEKIQNILIDTHIISSEFLKREVNIDLYLPSRNMVAGNVRLLLINDGQDLVTMNFKNILEELNE